MARRKRQKPSLAPAGREMGAATVRAVGAPGGLVAGYRRGADGALLVLGKNAEGGASVGIVRALRDPLDYYLHRQMISEEEYTAGDTLRRNQYSAFGSGFHASNLDGFHGTSNAADNWRFSPFKSDQLRAYMAALDAMPKKTAKLLHLVVIQGVYANEAARQIGEPPRRGFPVLKEGLAALVRFYRGNSGGPSHSRQRNP